LAIEGPRREGGKSRFELRPPASPIAVGSIFIDIKADYLDRPYQMVGETAGGRVEPLGSGTLARRPGSQGSWIEVAFPKTRAGSFALVVDDGDDAPIDLRGAKALVAVPDLFLAAPEGEYTLLVGQPRAPAARYELARARDLVLSVSAAPLEAGALQKNPAFEPPPAESRTEQYALWAVLAIAAIALSALTLRLARGEGDPQEPKKAPAQELKKEQTPDAKQEPAPEAKQEPAVEPKREQTPEPAKEQTAEPKPEPTPKQAN
jgi:hypothetical protein